MQIQECAKVRARGSERELDQRKQAELHEEGEEEG